MTALLSLISQAFQALFNFLNQAWGIVSKIGAKWWALAVGLCGILGDLLANGSNVLGSGVDRLAAMVIPQSDFSAWSEITTWTSFANTWFPLQEAMGMIVAYLTILIALAFMKMSFRFLAWIAGVTVRAMGWPSS